MGTFAVGSAAYTLMPSQSCERPPNAPQPSLLQSNAAECPPRSSSSSSSHGGSGGSSSSRSSYYSSDSSSSHSSSGTSRFRLAQRAARRLRLVCAFARLAFLRRRLTSMQRIVCPERDDWRATAESAGFDFHTIDGERYWDERAYYAFTLDEIERRIEAPTGEIDAMCLELVGRAIERRKISAPVEDTRSVLAAAVRELAPRRCQPLRPARPELRRLEPGETAGVQRGYADLDFRSGGFSVDLARTGDRAQHHPEARRPVQFNP